MKIKYLVNQTLAAIVFLTYAAITAAQSPAVLLPSQSSVTIKGTSSLHDWEEKVENFSVNLKLKFNESDIAGIDHVHFICKAGSITSDNSLMTSKTHDALKVEKYPDITFQLISVDNLSSKNGSFSGTLVGDVSLAGVSKRVSIAFTGLHKGSSISIKGEKELNMNDFKIKPPTAMLGTLKTGEQVTISFLLQFQVS
jgi:polyisoprenoid-binding protein YceI